MLTKQEAIVKSYFFLKKQGFTIGKYQDGETCCAVGCLMSKPLPAYDQRICISHLMAYNVNIHEFGLTQEDRVFYIELQKVNDLALALDFGVLDASFRKLALEQNLVSPC